MLKVNLGDSKDEVRIGILSGFLFRAELHSHTSQFFTFQVFNQVFRCLQHVFLEQFIYKWLVIRFRSALDDNTLEEFIDIPDQFLISSVEIDKDGFIGDYFEEFGELLLALLVCQHHLEALFELDGEDFLEHASAV